MTNSGGSTKQLDIFCRITGFTSDFFVEYVRFFHGALQLVDWCLTALSAQQIGYIMPEVYEIYQQIGYIMPEVYEIYQQIGYIMPEVYEIYHIWPGDKTNITKR